MDSVVLRCICSLATHYTRKSRRMCVWTPAFQTLDLGSGVLPQIPTLENPVWPSESCLLPYRERSLIGQEHISTGGLCPWALSTLKFPAQATGTTFPGTAGTWDGLAGLSTVMVEEGPDRSGCEGAERTSGAMGWGASTCTLTWGPENIRVGPSHLTLGHTAWPFWHFFLLQKCTLLKVVSLFLHV